MKKSSAENYYSQVLYKINQLNLYNKWQLDSIKKNRFSLKNVRIFFSYLFNGGFSRIVRRFKLIGKKQNCHTKYELKEYKQFAKKRIVVYTCVWGKYDTLLEPFFVNPNIDYIIFTDQEIPKDSVWKKGTIPNDLDVNKMSGVDVNRYFKMLPHRFFKEYDCSIYVDGNIRVVTDMMPIVTDLGDSPIGIHRYQVDCIYNMKDAIIAGKRAKRALVKKQLSNYKKLGFPKKFGAFECNVLVRNHNDNVCQSIMEEWWDEFNKTESKRDQLSLPYVLWKMGFTSETIFSLGQEVRMNPRFIISDKHEGLD